jgi:hypothetical protein
MKYFLISGLLMIHFVSQGQKKYGVINVYAFCSVQTPGNIPVDKDGNPMDSGPDTLYRVYLEANKSNDPIQWKFAWIHDKTYRLVSRMAETTVLEIGLNKTSHERIIIKASSGNVLWNLQLLSAEKAITQPLKAQSGEMILQGLYKHKKIIRKINTVVMLQLPPVQ